MQSMMSALLALAAFFLAYANGANDNFKGVATLYGSGASDREGALRLANAATFVGALTALALAGALTLKFGGRGLLPDAVTQTEGFPLAVAAGAAATVLLATRFGFPISTTHALLGALLGAGLAADPSAVLWGGLARHFVKPLLLSPFLAVAAIAVVYPLLHRTRRGLGIEKDSCACVAPMALQASDGSAWGWWGWFSGRRDDCATRYQGRVLGLTAHEAVDALHRASAVLVSFARGLNDTPKIAAILLLAGLLGHPLAIVATALAMLLGGVLGSRRVSETMAKGITRMDVGQGTASNLVTAGLVLGASALGAPVSTTHVSCGSLFGLGAVTGGARWRSIGVILLAWAVTLPVGAALGYVCLKAAARVGGI